MKKPKYLDDKDPWMLAENIPDSDIFFFQIPFSAFTSDTSYPFIKNYKKVIATYKKFAMNFYYGTKDSFEVAESILEALINRPAFGKKLNQNIVEWSQKLIEFAKQTAKLPLETFTNNQLWQIYENHDRLHTKLYTYGWLSVCVDMFHNNFTNKLKAYLYAICDSKEEAEKAFVLFTTPASKSIVAKEREEFLKIYLKFKQDLKNPTFDLDQALARHQKRWGHMGYIYAGNTRAFSVEHYLTELRDLAKTKVDAKQILAKEATQLRAAKKEQQKLYQQLRVRKLYRRLFRVAIDFALTKLVRRHAQLLDLYSLHQSLLTEIAKRLGLSRYQVQFMLKDEVKLALLEAKINRDTLKSRLKTCVYYTERNLETVFIGKSAKDFMSKLSSTTYLDQNEIKGQTAQGGYAKGIVKIIIRAKNMTKMNKGDILVSIATDPDIVPAMKKAAAIVTEQGGITSHAAIVSRELGIPCIIGTKIATKVLKDGMTVEVDANRGIVRIIR